uniref:Uncharacterized protein n=1 Tax=Anguilla anguilla TaxID=7936 RepID=A0A0E9WBE6_ANGAN
MYTQDIIGILKQYRIEFIQNAQYILPLFPLQTIYMVNGCQLPIC